MPGEWRTKRMLFSKPYRIYNIGSVILFSVAWTYFDRFIQFVLRSISGSCFLTSNEPCTEMHKTDLGRCKSGALDRIFDVNEVKLPGTYLYCFGNSRKSNIIEYNKVIPSQQVERLTYYFTFGFFWKINTHSAVMASTLAFHMVSSFGDCTKWLLNFTSRPLAVQLLDVSCFRFF